MVECGYDRTTFDHCVFVKKFYHGEFIVLLLYVDDMLILGRDIIKIDKLKEELSKSFVIKQMSMSESVSSLLVGHFK